MLIKEVRAKPIFDSNGKETVEVTVNKNYSGSAGVDSFNRWSVVGLPQSGNPVEIINNDINDLLKGVELNNFNDLHEVEALISDYDSSSNLRNFGGSSLVALESALLKSMAGKQDVWSFLNPYADVLPLPIVSCIGRSLSHNPLTDFEFNEILVLPSSEKLENNILVNKLIYNKIGERLKLTLKNHNGSWISNWAWNKVLYSLKYLVQDLKKELNCDIDLGVNILGTRLFNGEHYVYKKQKLNRDSQINFILDLVRKFDINYVEDPLEENDLEGFGKFNRGLICANSVLGSNIKRLNKAKNFVNTVVIKPTHVGSLIKAKEFIDVANSEGLNVVLGESLGETLDTLFSHLAVGWKVPYVKLNMFGKERRVKFNEFRLIDEKLV